MTVAALPAVVEYAEDGVSRSFPAPFRFKSATDIIVERLVAGEVQTLALGVDYAVTGGFTDAGGTITRSVATSGAVLRIRRQTARAQTMAYPTGGRFPAESHEEALDRAMLIAQEQDADQRDLSNRALLLPAGEVAPALAPLSQRIGGAKKVLAVDQLSGAIVVEPIGESFRGNTGPSNNTRADLAALKAAAITDKTSLYDGSLWTWMPGDFAGRADDATIVKSDAQALTVGAWVREPAVVNVDAFGARGDNTGDDRAAVIAAQLAVSKRGGGVVQFTDGKTYKISTPIPMQAGVTYRGTGRSAIDLVNAAPGARLVTSSSSIFINSADTITGVKFENLFLWSQQGGGHIFDWSLAGVVAKVEISGCTLIQENVDKHIVRGSAAGGVFSIWMHDFEYQYAKGNTVAPLNFVSPTINSIVIEKFWSTCSQEQTSGVWSIYFESANPQGGGINIMVRDGVFELPGGGCIKMLSCSNSGIENCGVYDMYVTPNNSMFVIDDGASGPPSSNCWLRGVRSTVGTPSKPDVFLNTSVPGQGQFAVSECTLSYLDGGGATAGPTILVTGGSITNIQNANYTRINGGPTLDLHFGTTDPAGKSYTWWNGYAGNFNGWYNLNRDGAYLAAFNPAGGFQLGGSRGTPNFQATASGMVYGTSFYVNGVKVVGVQQPAISDSLTTDQKVAAILAAIRAHGIIAT